MSVKLVVVFKSTVAHWTEISVPLLMNNQVLVEESFFSKAFVTHVTVKLDILMDGHMPDQVLWVFIFLLHPPKETFEEFL